MNGRLAHLCFVILPLMCWAAPLSAQPQIGFGLIDGMIVFRDADGDSQCAAVNTINADFFIRSCDRRLVLLRGNDRVTPFEVDEDYNVRRVDGVSAGHIRFATDNEGFRQVFWLSDDNFPEGENFVLRYNTDTDQLSVEVVEGQNNEIIPVAPINVTGTECDPTLSFDGGEDVLCEQPCGTGGLPALLGTSLTLLAMQQLLGLRRRRRRPSGPGAQSPDGGLPD